MFLAYRALTLKNIHFFLQNKELFENHDETYNVDTEKGKITEYLDGEKRKYRNLFNLVTHDEEGDEEFKLKQAVLTMFFLSLLEQNFWFEEFSSDVSSYSEERSYIGRLRNKELIFFISILSFHKFFIDLCFISRIGGKTSGLNL